MERLLRVSGENFQGDSAQQRISGLFSDRDLETREDKSQR